ncbi:N-acetylmuramoyl-L-alanine amidase [bacterium]|nr:N-acetylmuramoyl-L-alanine amidase [bacterium]
MRRDTVIITVIASALLTGMLVVWKSVKPSAQQEVLGESVTSIPTNSPTPSSIEISISTPTTGLETGNNEEKSPPQKLVPTTAPFLNAKQPKLVSTKAGTVTTLEYKELKKNTFYKIDLSHFEAESMVFSWPVGVTLYWSFENKVTFQDLTQLPIDDESLDYENERYSGLLAIPQNKIVYIYPNSNLNLLTVSLIRPSDNPDSFSIQSGVTGIYNFDSGASYTSQPIITRDVWGGPNASTWDSNSSANIDNESRLTWYPVYYKAARIIVHHTVTDSSTSTPGSVVRSIYLYHAYIKDGGWGDIGYNFLIDKNGNIYQGKLGGDETQGYHAFGSANRISIGIALIGDFTSKEPTTAQRSALIKLMAEKAAFYGFSLKYSDGGTSKWSDRSYTVFGHRTSYRWYASSDSWGPNQTACPGDRLTPKLPGIVTEAELYRQTNFNQIKSNTTEVNASFAAPHDEGTLVIEYNVPEDTAESVIESYLPKFSGITGYEIIGNRVTISTASTIVTHPNSDTEYLLPPMGWTGYDSEYQTFTPALVLNGPEDRAKTLLKIFKMDPRVKAADVKHYLGTQ